MYAKIIKYEKGRFIEMTKIYKLITVFLSMILLLAFSSIACAADNNQPTVTMQIGNPEMAINGVAQPIDEAGTAPVTRSGRTLLPIRAFVEGIGGSVSWNEAGQTMTLTYQNKEINMTLGAATATLNGAAQTLDVAPVAINNRTMLPIRFIAESFGYTVLWDTTTQTITLQPAGEAGEEPADEQRSGKTLVVYFSMPETTNPNNMTTEEDNSVVVIDGEVLGNTQYMAYVIQRATGGDIFRIEPQTPYPTDHSTLVSLAYQEQSNNARPAIAAQIANFADYDTVFVGYPIWWSDLPQILYTFFDEYDFSGKTIIPFSTHGGSSFAGTPATIRGLEPEATMLEGLTISRNNIQDAEQEIIRWVNGLAKK